MTEPMRSMLDGVASSSRYGGGAAVRDLDLEVGRGEIVGLIGPNGAGKSTTLHAIMGLVAPRAEGEIRLAGTSILRSHTRGCGAERDRTRARRPADLRRAHGRGEPPARVRCAPRGGSAEDETDAVFDLFPIVKRVPAARRSVFRAASSSNSRLRGRSSRARMFSSSTSRRSASRRRRRRRLRGAGARSASRGITVLLVEQRAQRTVALRRSQLRDRERRAAAHADAGRRERHRRDGGGVPVMTPRSFSTRAVRRSSMRSARALSTR